MSEHEHHHEHHHDHHDDHINEEIRKAEERLAELRREAAAGAPAAAVEIARNPFLIPGSIVLAGIVVALAIVYAPKLQQNGPVAAVTPPPAAQPGLPGPEGMQEVSSADHIRGSRSAQVIIVEFSDLECPFCKTFHQTMKQAMNTYGGDGRLAWVYRHFPLDGLHPKARKEAEASECAAELGGNDAFWKYIDRLFEVTPSNNGLDPAALPDIAQTIGLDRAAFTTCLNSGKYAEKVDAQVKDAAASGARGTPYGVLIAPNGTRTPVGGALPYEQIQQLIDTALKEQ